MPKQTLHALLFLLVFVLPTFGQPTLERGQSQEKLPVPEEAARQEALELIQEVYQEQYAAATTDQLKVALAKKLLDNAKSTTSNPTNRYVLLRVSKDLADQVGHLETAYAAIGQLAQHYQVDRLQLKAEALVDASKAAKRPIHYQGLSPEFIRLINEAAAADRYEITAGLKQIALSSARKARDSDLIEEVTTAIERSEYQQQATEKVQASLTRLDRQPTDPTANLAVGRYFCLVKNQWEKGIPMLVLGSDGQLQSLALKELTDHPEKLSIADGWWELAAELPELEARNVKRHAATYYRREMPLLSGFAKKRVESRMAEFQEQVPRLSTPYPPTLLLLTLDKKTIREEQGNMIVTDLSRFNNHGIVKGSELTEGGKLGEAMWFRGKGQYIEFPSLRQHLIRDLSSITICCWVKSLDSRLQVIFDVGHFADNSLSLTCTDKLYDVAINNQRFMVAKSGEEGHHLTMIWTGDRIIMYINGEEKLNRAHGNFTLNPQTITNHPARLGRHAKAVSDPRHLHGSIDEFAIFAGALNPEQVQAIYRQGLIEALK